MWAADRDLVGSVYGDFDEASSNISLIAFTLNSGTSVVRDVRYDSLQLLVLES